MSAVSPDFVPVVEHVVWTDAVSTSGWGNDKPTADDSRVDTVGIVVYEDSEWLTIAPTVTLCDSDWVWCGSMWIPKTLIRDRSIVNVDPD